ncbi:hypothetical protein ACUNV4_04925 [Granulosicoccus sp. 3-233]|uniref:hypothetical protein n=1 Tax=Granulosicoccus sp. 3-233 TaxID=3417969 RepID=UPI003D345D6B
MGLKLFLSELLAGLPTEVETQRLDCHINDEEFVEHALRTFDDGCARGIVVS